MLFNAFIAIHYVVLWCGAAYIVFGLAKVLAPLFY